MALILFFLGNAQQSLQDASMKDHHIKFLKDGGELSLDPRKEAGSLPDFEKGVVVISMDEDSKHFSSRSLCFERLEELRPFLGLVLREEGKGRHMEVFPEVRLKGDAVKVRKIEDQTMGRKYEKSFILERAEVHHDVLEGISACRIFIPIRKGGFVSMVTVCDENGLVPHPLSNVAEELGISDRPEGVTEVMAIDIIEEGGWREGLFEEAVNGLKGVGVKREDRADIGPAGLQDLQTVPLLIFMGALVREDHSISEGFEAAEADESPPGLSLSLVHREIDSIKIVSRLLLRNQYSFLLPLSEIGGAAPVPIRSQGWIAQFEADDIIRVFLEVPRDGLS